MFKQTSVLEILRYRLDAGLQQLLQEVERRIVDKDSNAETKAQNRKSVRDAFSA